MKELNLSISSFRIIYCFIFGKECLVFGNIICSPFRMYCLAPYTVPLGSKLDSRQQKVTINSRPWTAVFLAMMLEHLNSKHNLKYPKSFEPNQSQTWILNLLLSQNKPAKLKLFSDSLIYSSWANQLLSKWCVLLDISIFAGPCCGC